MRARAFQAESTLFVSDLDFTLLNSDARLSERTVDVVNRLLAAGYWFTCATARSFSSTMRVTGRLNLTLPVITYGGAVTFDPVGNTRIDVRPIAARTVEAICAVTADRPTVEPLLYAIMDGRDRVCWRSSHATEFTQTFVGDRAGNPRLLPVADWSELPPDGVFYATLIGERQDITAVRDELASHLDGCFSTLGPDGYRPDQTWLEIFSLDATKAAAVSRLQNSLDSKALVVFGDNLNDVPMFTIADHSCAVANAVPELIALASEVIGGNADDGVAEWIARHFLDEQTS
jgi:Cof subfamily protein (haloacid dehalogenase superfamily)